MSPSSRGFLVGLIGTGIGPSLTPPLHEREADELGLDETVLRQGKFVDERAGFVRVPRFEDEDRARAARTVGLQEDPLGPPLLENLHLVREMALKRGLIGVWRDPTDGHDFHGELRSA